MATVHDVAFDSVVSCGSNHPAIEKIYFLVHHADNALNKSSSCLMMSVALVHQTSLL